MNLRKRLKSGKPLLADGAMGTMLQQRGFENTCLEELNLKKPEIIREITLAYINAGAELIQTNTFGANPFRLSDYGLSGETEEINRAAVEIASDVKGKDCWITGSVGPCGKQLVPFGDLSHEEYIEGMRRQIGSLIDSGVDAVSIETVMDVEEALLATRIAGDISDEIVIISSATFNRTPNGFFTPYGNTPEEFVKRLEQAGADVVGANCSIGMDSMIEIAGIIRKATSLPLLIKPNAGLPEIIDGKPVWNETPDKFAKGAKLLLDEGVNIIGGCCGTMPEYIRMIRKMMEESHYN